MCQGLIRCESREGSRKGQTGKELACNTVSVLYLDSDNNLLNGKGETGFPGTMLQFNTGEAERWGCESEISMGYPGEILFQK